MITTKEHRVVAGMSEQDISGAAVGLLNGPALDLYRLRGKEWRLWQDAVTCFRKHYQDKKYSERFADEARARLQINKQPVHEYITAMRLILNRMTEPSPEKKQVKPIY